MHVYTLEMRMYKDEFDAKFAFHASSLSEAEDKARKWARYHGMQKDDVRVREATEHEAKNWLHDEYMK